MIPLSTFKQILGDEAKGLSDAEIERIRDASYQLADAIIEFWLRKKNQPPNPPQAD